MEECSYAMISIYEYVADQRNRLPRSASWRREANLQPQEIGILDGHVGPFILGNIEDGWNSFLW